MNFVRPLARRLLALPPAVHASESSTTWVAMADGTRLATRVVLPDAPGRRFPAVLIRTALPTTGRGAPAGQIAHLLAESGHAAVIQECRGRYASEGRFTPFAHEAEDGRDTIAWIAEQPWFGGRLALVGHGYAGTAAWAALSASPHPVQALVVGLAARDPYVPLHPGGALAFEAALRFAARIGERTLVPDDQIDLERGVAFRPVRGADRVALRRIDWFRDWIDHPARDDTWRALAPDAPVEPPATLLLAGAFDAALAAQLDDFDLLSQAAERSGGPAPELVLGPWPASRATRRAGRVRDIAFSAVGLRETLGFLDRRLHDRGEIPPPVRFFVSGENRWRHAAAWPVPGATPRDFYLCGGGRANGRSGDGRLAAEAPAAEEPPDRLRYDPEDPVPSLGGFGCAGGPADQRAVEARADVLCYTTPSLDRALVVVGRIRAVLYVASTAPDADFTAKLVDVHPDGAAINVCDGILRCRRREGGAAPVWLTEEGAERIEIDLFAACARFGTGHRIRLEVSSSNFPRFDRNSSTRAEPGLVDANESRPATQTVFHDAEHPSRLILPVRDDA